MSEHSRDVAKTKVKYSSHSIAVYLTPLIVFGLSLGCEQIFAADADKASQKTDFFVSKSNITPSNVMPATSGVKLLEGIFLKLRSQPQLAFVGSRTPNAVARSSTSSPTDQLLAIRPAERGPHSAARFEYAPNSYNLDAPTSRSASRQAKVQPKSLAASIQNLASAAGAVSSLQDISSSADSSGIRNYHNSSHYLASAKSSGSNNLSLAQHGQLIASTPMITEFRNASSFSGAKDLAPMSTNEISGTSSFASAGKGGAGGAENTLMRSKKARSTFMQPPPPVSAPTPAAAQTPGTEDSRDASVMVPTTPGLFKNIREIKQSEKFALGPGVKEMEDKSDKFSEPISNIDKRQIALLPPSIVSGVPLVHLGASGLQIKKSLGSHVSITGQVIDGWTVWSVSRARGEECAMQLYLKHGVVEAIRVFDSRYLGPELGVKLGNDLQTIKERFGEPAFILPEPISIPGLSLDQGKNYIYPISQVSFSLSRSRDKAHPAPQVMSMLIFNVE